MRMCKTHIRRITDILIYSWLYIYMHTHTCRYAYYDLIVITINVGSIMLVNMIILCIVTCMFNRASDSGPFEKGTLYIRPLYKGHCFRFQNSTFPIVLIRTSEKRTTYLQETNQLNLYCSQSVPCSEVLLYILFLCDSTLLLVHRTGSSASYGGDLTKAVHFWGL